MVFWRKEVFNFTCFIYDCSYEISWRIQHKGDAKVESSSRLETPITFLKGTKIIWNMLKDVKGKDKVERIVLES